MENTFKEIDTKTIGHRLKELRAIYSKTIGRRYTQKDLAEALNVKQSIISRLEQGQGSIPVFIQTLFLYQSFGYNILWILYPDNSKQNITIDDYDAHSLYKTVSLDDILLEKTDSIYKLAELIEQSHMLVRTITNTK